MRVAITDGQLEVRSCGDGPPVVLIHGTAPAVWGELPALLADRGFRAISYDRRSFGASRVTPPTGLSTHADDAAAVIGACGAPATIVGWSIGGVIALEVAARHPELADGLVLVEPALHLKRHPRPAMVSAIAGATVLGKLGRSRAGATRFLRWALGRRDGTTDLDAMPADWRARLATDDAAAVVRELSFGTGEHLDPPRLAGIHVPVQVLRGDQSQKTFADAARRTADAIPGAALIDVPGAGHAVQLDAPGTVADAVDAVQPGRRSPPIARSPSRPIIGRMS